MHVLAIQEARKQHLLESIEPHELLKRYPMMKDLESLRDVFLSMGESLAESRLPSSKTETTRVVTPMSTVTSTGSQAGRKLPSFLQTKERQETKSAATKVTSKVSNFPAGSNSAIFNSDSNSIPLPYDLSPMLAERLSRH